MKQTIAERLAAAGWTETDARAIGSIAGRGAELNVTPRVKAIGAPIPLRTLLPPGARVEAMGGRGVVEYSPTSYYVRLVPLEDFEEPCIVLRAMIADGATIEDA